jgi:hypothetical protein
LKNFLPEELIKRYYPAWNNRILLEGTTECFYCWATSEIIDLLNPFFKAYKLTLYDYHTDNTNEVGYCTIIRLVNTLPTMRIQVTSQENTKGTWNQFRM